MTLAPDDFIGRSALHPLPRASHRIRHYGLLASAGCNANIARARELIAAPVPSGDIPTEPNNPDQTASAATDHRPPCPCCGGGVVIGRTVARSRRARPARVGPPPERAGAGVNLRMGRTTKPFQ